MNEFYADGECKECGKEILLGYFRCQDCYEKGDIDKDERAYRLASSVSEAAFGGSLIWATVPNDQFQVHLEEVLKRLREGRDDG